MGKTLIIGAGISGLSSAYFLKKPYIVFEKNSSAGGLCRSFYDEGFTYDCSGHFIHIKDDKIKSLVKKLCGGIDEIERKASVFIEGKCIPFPFQSNLYYLDEKIKKECVDGILKRKDVKISTSMPFADWSEAMFGRGINKYFMKPYNEKLWSFDLKKMTAAWTGPFVPRPDAESIVKSAYTKNRRKYGYNSVFYYPEKKGCQALTDGLLKYCRDIKCGLSAEKIDLKNKILKTSDGKEYGYENIISTQPLPELVKSIKNLPKNIQAAAKKLKCSSVRCINLGIKSSKGIPKILKNKHWIYIPNKKIPFYRIGIYSNVNALSAPRKHYSFYVEFSSSDGKYKNCDNVINDMKQAGFIRREDEIVSVNIVDMPYAYVIFDNDRQKALDTIMPWLNKNNIYSIGRYGAWEYSFIEKNIKDAFLTAEMINGK